MTEHPVHERRIDVGHITLNVAIQGEGEPIVFLHGFPQFWYCWRHQMALLSTAGYKAVAPDLRGYHKSDRPKGVRNYDIREVTRDIAALIRTMGGQATTIAGHDWGGLVGWCLASLHPELVERLIVINAPHPNRMVPTFLRHPEQLLRSSYGAVAMLPWLPERLVQSAAVMDRFFRAYRNKDAFPAAVRRKYLEAIREPGAANAALNYYRAAIRYGAPSLEPVVCPTLVIWGDRDIVMGKELIEGTDTYADDLSIHHLPDTGHWVPEEEPELVSQDIITFLTR